MAALSLYASSSKSSVSPPQSEFDILKAAHKFLRDDEAKPDSQRTWNEQLARKYYETLYREFAVCDLKHYKSGNFALRWRTESEVLSGAGETTCANTRCEHHHAPQVPEDMPPLSTLELPFAYTEHGEHKVALVKAVLCEKCCKRIMWKRKKEKEREEQCMKDVEVKLGLDVDGGELDDHRARGMRKGHRAAEGPDVRRRRNSRSLSPRSRHKSMDGPPLRERH